MVAVAQLPACRVRASDCGLVHCIDILLFFDIISLCQIKNVKFAAASFIQNLFMRKKVGVNIVLLNVALELSETENGLNVLTVVKRFIGLRVIIENQEVKDFFVR